MSAFQYSLFAKFVKSGVASGALLCYTETKGTARSGRPRLCSGKERIPVKNLFSAANEYARRSDWKDFALLKFCLCAMGIMIGAHIAPRHKHAVTAAAAAVFIATYIPLMAKFLKIWFPDPQ